MAYILRSLVRKFRILQIRRIDLFKFKIFQTILRNQSSLTPIFCERFIFISQTSSDVIDLTGVFYQTIFQYILNGYFVLNNGNKKGTFWAYVKYDKIYMCVVLVYFLTSRNYVCFLKFLTVRYIVGFVNKTSRDKTESGNGSIG